MQGILIDDRPILFRCEDDGPSFSVCLQPVCSNVITLFSAPTQLVINARSLLAACVCLCSNVIALVLAPTQRVINARSLLEVCVCVCVCANAITLFSVLSAHATCNKRTFSACSVCVCSNVITLFSAPTQLVINARSLFAACVCVPTSSLYS